MIDRIRDVSHVATSEFRAQVAQPTCNHNLVEGIMPSSIDKGFLPYVTLNEVALHSLFSGTLKDRSSGLPSCRKDNIAIADVLRIGIWHEQYVDSHINGVPIDRRSRQQPAYPEGLVASPLIAGGAGRNTMI